LPIGLGRFSPADLVHAHTVGAWWAAAQAVPPHVPLVASEHNQMSWPSGDHTAQAQAAARRVGMLFCHGPAVRAWAAGLGLGGRLREGRSAVQGLSARPWPGLPSPRLTFTGRFRADKAPDVLVEALALLGAPPPAHLVGDGPMRPALAQLVWARGRPTVVRLPGWSYKPSRYVTGPASTSYPPGRSPGRKAPWWHSALASRSLAPPSTAWHTPWATAAASSSHPTTRTLCGGAVSRPGRLLLEYDDERSGTLRPASAGPR